MQPFNSKDPTARVTECIRLIRATGASAQYDQVVEFLTAWNRHAGNAQVKTVLGQAMHQGFHVEVGRSDEVVRVRKAVRDKRRAMILMRAIMLNEAIPLAKATVERIPEINVSLQLGYLVGESATRLMGPPNLSLPSGRFQRSGMRSPNNRAHPFFTSQDDLFRHFRDVVQVGIVNGTTMAVYRAALLTVGNPVWGSGQSDPGSVGRFDAFGGTEDGQGTRMNCWEALLFWACKANALTVAGCRKLYREGNLVDTSANIRSIFGTQVVFDANAAQPGDVLAWVNTVNCMNHLAMYAGMGPDGITPYLIQNLSFDAVRDGIGAGMGSVHFRSVARMVQDYTDTYGAATLYRNQPFWIPGSPQYPYLQHLMT